jgi:osmoprotectant transport system substrate-binding protein
MREDALQRWPKIRVALAALQGRVTASEMQTMNEEIDGQHRDPADVVREFRQKKGL